MLILNDGCHGFTINGKGFPATQPFVAKLGQKLRIRYMNEGMMIHPMHLHGMHMTVIAKDGWAQPRLEVRHPQHRPRRALGRDRELQQSGTWASTATSFRTPRASMACSGW